MLSWPFYLGVISFFSALFPFFFLFFYFFIFWGGASLGHLEIGVDKFWHCPVLSTQKAWPGCVESEIRVPTHVCARGREKVGKERPLWSTFVFFSVRKGHPLGSTFVFFLKEQTLL